MTRMLRHFALGFIATLGLIAEAFSDPLVAQFDYQPSPLSNPLRGLVPYADAPGADQFPHSMEFSYFALSDFITGRNANGSFAFRADALEKMLDRAQSRGNQSIFRVYIDYPGKPTGLPAFLSKEGVAVSTFPRDSGSAVTITDYDDERLISAVEHCIAELGKRYDGDPRLGFITMGFLGLWGEWHTYPHNSKMAAKATQQRVYDAFAQAFKTTPVLNRYPAGPDHDSLIANSDREVGYHDDSFAWSTLPTRDWHFLTLMDRAGAREKWRSQPIGGEIRPELWKTLFTDSPHRQQQDFAACIQSAHVTWLMDSSMFREAGLSTNRRARAYETLAGIGYELHVVSVHHNGQTLALSIKNTGVAPFYANWPLLITLASGREISVDFAFHTLMPSETISRKIPTGEGGPCTISIPNPMEGGKPVVFATAGATTQGLKIPQQPKR